MDEPRLRRAWWWRDAPPHRGGPRRRTHLASPAMEVDGSPWRRGQRPPTPSASLDSLPLGRVVSIRYPAASICCPTGRRLDSLPLMPWFATPPRCSSSPPPASGVEPLRWREEKGLRRRVEPSGCDKWSRANTRRGLWSSGPSSSSPSLSPSLPPSIEPLLSGRLSLAELSGILPRYSCKEGRRRTPIRIPL
jgi:hypothetical protein